MTSTQFCPLCDCFLWLELEEETKNLMYHCKNCDNIVEHKHEKSLCVLDNNFSDDDTSYKQYINKYLKHDPTLPRVNNIACPNPDCTNPPGEGDEVIFVKYDFANMKYIYHCVHCSHFWTPTAKQGL